MNANGNLTNRGSDTFAYDQANRLTSATVSGTTSTDTYDGDGKRASQTVGTNTTSYVDDVNGSLPNVLTDGTNKYVYGLGLAYAVDSSGNVQVDHTDGLGSVRAITNGSGTLIQTYQADEFGIPTQSNGTSTQPFGCTGQQVDGNELVYLRAREYDPTMGRFLSQDPLLGSVVSPLSLNAFSYVLNNPIALIDPRGLSSSQVIRNGSTDNECVSTGGGTYPGYVVNALCLNMPMGIEVVIASVDTPPPPHEVVTVFFAKPPQGTGGNQNETSGSKKSRSPNDRQNKSFRDAVRVIERQIGGKKLSPDEIQRLHLEITKKGYTFWQILEEGIGMFGR